MEQNIKEIEQSQQVEESACGCGSGGCGSHGNDQAQMEQKIIEQQQPEEHSACGCGSGGCGSHSNQGHNHGDLPIRFQILR